MHLALPLTFQATALGRSLSLLSPNLYYRRQIAEEGSSKHGTMLVITMLLNAGYRKVDGSLWGVSNWRLTFSRTDQPM